mgnify:CR=1 FL=1
MEYRNLGRTELTVSELCLGTMQFGWSVSEAESFEILSAAFNAGINFIDTADMYSNWVNGNPGGISETFIGKWMKQRDIPREQIVIATKVRGRMGPSPNDEGLSRQHIFDAVEGSLQRLQIETIDLYQTHWPDNTTPIDETLHALDDLVQQGLARYIGCSNYQAGTLTEALLTSDRNNLARYDSLQPHYSLVHRTEYEREMAAICHKYGLGVIPYSPLAAGFLTGKYRKDRPLPESVRSVSAQKHMTVQNWDVLDKLESFGKTRGKSISQMSLGWLLTRHGITAPIIGPRTIEQLNDNLGAAGLRLSAAEMEALE